MGSMKIWIDADAAPNDVKEIVFRASARLELETALVANQPLSTPASNPLVDSLRTAGVETGGPKPYGQREKQEFANALDRLLTKHAG